MSDSAQHGSVKETLISIIISLAMALVAKAYVVEAFVIPTGSMAPTLLGQHMHFRSDETGYDWSVNPWFFVNGGDGPPTSTQAMQTRSGALTTAVVTDPMTTSQINPPRRSPRAGHSMQGVPKRLRSGDRILVQKLLYELVGPERFDVVVFKNPEDPTQNFIKRLVGMPGEAIFIVDGDVFTAPADDGAVPDDWNAFQVRRKPVIVQRDLWRPIFSSEYTPDAPLDASGHRFFTSPWQGEGWNTDDQRVYRFDASTPARLAWNNDRWPINDWNPYNEVRPEFGFKGGRALLNPGHYFPVSDLRLRAGVEPEQDGLTAIASIETRGHTFEALLDGTDATLRAREAEGPWRTLASAPLHALRAGTITDIEFWHADQRLILAVNGRTVLESDYDWNPSERLLRVIGKAADEVESRSKVLEAQNAYAGGVPTVSWRFEGSPVALHRVGLDKDIYFRPDATLRACHPDEITVLDDDQFFVLGDNSAASADGRKWTTVDPEVAKVDPTLGVVPERLMLGKAFFVYFPAPHSLAGRVPIPDVGRMRAIH